MIETEIKLRVLDDLEKIRLWLSSVNAVFVKRVVEEDVYYQHPCRDFAKTDEALRIRRIAGAGSECLITYKGRRIGSQYAKKRVEIEIGVSDCDKAAGLLEALGFKKVAVVVKDREYYRAGACTITIDRLRGLGLFIEVECDEKQIKDIISKLKARYEVVPETYLELVLRRKKS